MLGEPAAQAKGEPRPWLAPRARPIAYLGNPITGTLGDDGVVACGAIS